MRKFKYELSIEATNETDAEMKIKALVVLASKLKPHELEKMAHVLNHDPVKTALAKKFLG